MKFGINELYKENIERFAEKANIMVLKYKRITLNLETKAVKVLMKMVKHFVPHIIIRKRTIIQMSLGWICLKISRELLKKRMTKIWLISVPRLSRYIISMALINLSINVLMIRFDKKLKRYRLCIFYKLVSS